MIKIYHALSVVLLMILASALHGASAQDEKPITLYWEDLLPSNEDLVLERLAAAKQPKPEKSDKSGTNDFLVIDALDGYKVRIPGFIVPLEFSPDGRLSDFLLVPYQGACIHEPPPAPNQVVYAKSDKPQPFPNIWTPVWITGTLSTDHYLNDLGDAAYTLKIDSWDIYRGRE